MSNDHFEVIVAECGFPACDMRQARGEHPPLVLKGRGEVRSDCAAYGGSRHGCAPVRQRPACGFVFAGTPRARTDTVGDDRTHVAQGCAAWVMYCGDCDASR